MDNYNKIKDVGDRINLIVFFIMVIISALFFSLIEVDLSKNENLYNNIKYILLVSIIIFYISFFLHEIGHPSIFRIYGYKLLCFKVGPISVINNNGSVEMKIDKKNIFSGATIPRLKDKFDKIYDINNFSREIKKSLSGGIIVNLILIIISFIVSLNITNNKTQMYMHIIQFVNLYAILCSAYKKYDLYGDLIAMKLIFQDKGFAVNYFTNSIKIEKGTNKILVREMEKYICRKLESGHYNTLICNDINVLLEEYILNDYKIPNEINKFNEWLLNNLEKLEFNIHYKVVCINLISTIIYLNIAQNNRLLAYNRFVKLKEFILQRPSLGKSKIIDVQMEQLENTLNNRNDDIKQLEVINNFYYKFDNYKVRQLKFNEKIRLSFKGGIIQIIMKYGFDVILYFFFAVMNRQLSFKLAKNELKLKGLLH
jgi:hypothetical protein